MNPPEIYVNLLVEWHDQPAGKGIERLLWISPDGNSLIFIGLDNDSSLPFERLRSELESAFRRGEFHPLSTDPFAFLQCQEHLIPEAHRKRRNEAWEVIVALVEP